MSRKDRDQDRATRRASRRTWREEERMDRMAGNWRSKFGRRKLRLDKERAIFLGVGAGIASYIGIEAWQARLALIALLILTEGLVIVFYLIFWFILRKEKEEEFEGSDSGVDKKTKKKAKSKRSKKSSPRATIVQDRPRIALRVVQGDFDELELKLRRVEKFVASGQYDLHRGFNEIGAKS
ncbi:MAG: PspC domain-containing protein [Gammaproteobacteria bacterium]|nr:PspC domain-containing protein [Gammaproteobacteria bacterium]